MTTSQDLLKLLEYQEEHAWPPPPTTRETDIDGLLAVKVLLIAGQNTGWVTLRETTSVTGYSEYTWWHEYEFELLVDGVLIWSTYVDDEDNGLNQLLKWIEDQEK